MLHEQKYFYSLHRRNEHHNHHDCNYFSKCLIQKEEIQNKNLRKHWSCLMFLSYLYYTYLYINPYYVGIIWEALHDLIQFAQFKTHEKHPSRTVTFRKGAGWTRNASHVSKIMNIIMECTLRKPDLPCNVRLGNKRHIIQIVAM